MADLTNLSTYDQYQMGRVCDALTSAASVVEDTVRDLNKWRDRFVNSAALMAWFNAAAAGDHMHGQGKAPTKADLTDLSDLCLYLNKRLFNVGAVPAGWDEAKCATVLARFAGG